MAEKDKDVKEEIVRLDQYESLSSDTTRWKPSPDIEDACIDLLKDIMPLKLRPTDLMIEKYYEKGYNQYKAGRYKQAVPFFQMLTVLNPKQTKYVMALAACFHMLKEYEEAITYYTLAAMFDDLNPLPQYHMAGCLIKLDQPLGAMIALEMGIQRSEGKARFKAICDRMKMMKESLHKELMEKKEQGFEGYFHPENENAPTENTPTENNPA